MADKLLKTLTFGNSSLDTFVISRQDKSKSGITLSANTIASTDYITLTEGQYIILVYGMFPTSTTTGNCRRDLGVLVQGNPNIQEANNYFDTQSSSIAYRVNTMFRTIPKGTTQNIAGAMRSEKASNSGGAVYLLTMKIGFVL